MELEDTFVEFTVRTKKGESVVVRMIYDYVMI